MTSFDQRSTSGFHPFLQAAIDGETGTQIKLLRSLIGMLQELHGTFLVNGKELTKLVLVTDNLVQESKGAVDGTNKAIETLVSRLEQVEQIALAVQGSIEGMRESIEANTAEFKTLKRVLGDLPPLVADLEKLMQSLTARMKEPLTVRVDLPPQVEAVPAELLTSWQSLIVDVVGRNYQGNIETVRIRKES